MRFTAPQTHADHLDWHYRENRRKKVAHRAVTHRGWFCSETEWIKFEETADPEESAKSKFFEKAHEELILKRQEA
ncbi:Pre-mRNA cleavage complex 2 protein Pcf11, partial [Buceros rhinoceros silvestris]